MSFAKDVLKHLFFLEGFALIGAHMDPYGLEESQIIRKILALLKAFKGPVTLP